MRANGSGGGLVMVAAATGLVLAGGLLVAAPSAATVSDPTLQWAGDLVCGTNAADLPVLKGPLSDSDATQALQVILRDEGYSPGEANGRYGAKTRSAVRRMQKREDVPRGANVDTKTWRALRNSFCPSFD